jgi:DNA repair protein RadC
MACGFMLTSKIKSACQYHDIKVADHLIATSESYYSFADEGLLFPCRK